MKFVFWKHKKEVEQLRQKMISDKGDEVAMLRAANEQIVAILEKIKDRSRKNIKDAEEALNHARR